MLERDAPTGRQHPCGTSEQGSELSEPDPCSALSGFLWSPLGLLGLQDRLVQLIFRVDGLLCFTGLDGGCHLFQLGAEHLQLANQVVGAINMLQPESPLAPRLREAIAAATALSEAMGAIAELQGLIPSPPPEAAGGPAAGGRRPAPGP